MYQKQVSRISALIALVILWAATGAGSSVYANLITNGDFEAGNTGFSTSYGYSPGNLIPANVYDVLASTFPAHSAAVPYGDHTTGSGLMMAINGGANPAAVVWSQSVPVNPNTGYTFTGWVSSWLSGSPANLDFRINGVSIGMLAAPGPSGVWIPFSANWNSGAAVAASIQIFNSNPAASGNDFALDDLSLVPRTGACCANLANAVSDCIVTTQEDCNTNHHIYLNDGTDCTSFDEVFCTTLLVTFESLSAHATPQGVVIRWTTATEVDAVGFRILRERLGTREKALKVIAPMIPAGGDGLTGASYEFLDNSIRPGLAVQYYIEDIDIFGKVTRHGPLLVDRGSRRIEAPAGRVTSQAERK